MLRKRCLCPSFSIVWNQLILHPFPLLNHKKLSLYPISHYMLAMQARGRIGQERLFSKSCESFCVSSVRSVWAWRANGETRDGFAVLSRWVTMYHMSVWCRDMTMIWCGQTFICYRTSSTLWALHYYEIKDIQQWQDNRQIKDKTWRKTQTTCNI